MSAEKRVRRGIEYLDGRAASGLLPENWRAFIDCETLQLEDTTSCVLGQLRSVAQLGEQAKYGASPYLAVIFAWELGDHEVQSLGFDAIDDEDYEELQAAWEDALCV